MTTRSRPSLLLTLALAACTAKPAEQAPSAVEDAPPLAPRQTESEESERPGSTCKSVEPDQRIHLPLSKTYTAENVIHLVVTTTCKRAIYSRRDAQREHTDPAGCDDPTDETCAPKIAGRDIMAMAEHKLAPLGMTVIDRGDEAVFVVGTPARPGPEPSGADRIELDPNAPPGTQPMVELPPGPPPESFPVDLGCAGGSCVFDGTAVGAALNENNLRARLIPNAKIPDGYKIYGLSERSFYWAAGLRNADTLVELDGAPATTALTGDDPPAALAEIVRGLIERGGRVELRLSSRDGVDKLVTLETAP